MKVIKEALKRKIFREAQRIFLSFAYRFKVPYAPQPRMLSIEATQLCNLKCSMCFREEVNVKKNSISVEEFKQVLSKFPRLKYLSLIGLGEILMHPNISEIVRIARAKSSTVAITTNGTLLTEKNIGKLDGVGRIYVSIDSLNAERYKAIRGADLRDVIEGVQRLRKIMPHVLLFIQAVMREDNIADIPDFPGFAKEVGADGVSLLHILPLNPEQDKMHLINVADAGAYIDKTIAAAKEMDVELSLRPLRPKEKYCNYPWMMPYITLKGDIYACPFVCRSEEAASKEFYMGESIDVPNHQYKVGNIFKDDFKKIWNGTDMQLLRKKLAGFWTDRELSIEEFLEKRRNVNLQERFSYCEICLFRWGCGC